MRLFLLNQFVPPDSAPTARLLGDLETAFSQAGWATVLIGKKEGYRSGKKGGVARILRDALAHLQLLWAGLRAGPCDWIVCLSDPPGLPFTAALLARVKKASLAHWAMDVYPEVAVKLGALPDGMPSRLVGAAMRFGYRQCDLLVALDEDMRRVIGGLGISNIEVLPPWPPPFPMSKAAEWSAQAPRRTWLYSGNLGRAHEYRDLLQAQQQLEARGRPWQLVFQGGGPCVAEAKAYASQLGLKHCVWMDYASDERLLSSLIEADALIATQKESMLGLLWPSKLAVLQLVGRPIVWVGPALGQIGATLRADSPRHGVFAPGEAEAIANWLDALPPTDWSLDPSPEGIEEKLRQLRERGFSQFLHWIHSAHRSNHVA